MRVFREHGYEGATLVDLQEAMGGITPPSFYAAFGSKEALFKEVLELYCKTEGAPTRRALEETASTRGAIEGMLRAAALSFTKPGEPRGCLLTVGGLSCSAGNGEVEAEIRALRRQTRTLITKRLKRGIAEGDLPPDVDVGTLSSFFATVVQGLSIQAGDGVSREALLAAVDGAMAAWDGLVGTKRR
jgi:AcrR family transcriptional regulator